MDRRKKDSMKAELKLYVVKNKEGKYFRARGRYDYGDSWVEDLKNAKIYTRIGSARGIVTYWYRNYPEYGMPELIEIIIKSEYMTVLEEGDRVKNVIKKSEQRKLKREEYYNKRRIEYLGNKAGII